MTKKKSTSVIDPNKTIKQSNRLIEAKYKLTSQEQKLVIAICAQLDKNAANFDTIRIKVADFANFCNIKSTDIIIEIGPGNGVITEKLCQKAKKVTSIELDERLHVYLDSLELKYSNLEVIYQNVLNTYLPKCDKIITSLPYSIIEPFINKMIKCEFNELIMIMGETYIDDVINNSNNKLALLTNAYFKAEKLREIDPSSFKPSPRTVSGIIKLIPKSLEETKNDFKLFIIRELFFYRDMKIKNALKESIIKYNNCTQRKARELLSNLNIEEELLENKFETISNTYTIRLIEYIDKLEREIS